MRVWVLGVLLLLAACNEEPARPGAEPASPAPVAAMARSDAAGAEAGQARALERILDLTLGVASATLEATVQAHADACVEPACEVGQLSVSGTGAYRRGTLHLRIAPAALAGFLARVTRDGEVTERRETSRDLTAPTLDAEARLRGQRALLERLRAVLAGNPAMPLADLLAWEREAARVQTEIESAESQLRALGQRTGGVAVRIDYVAAEAQAGGRRWWWPIAETLGESLELLAGSTAAALGFAIQALPWVPILALGWFGIGWLRRRLVRRPPV